MNDILRRLKELQDTDDRIREIESRKAELSAAQEVLRSQVGARTSGLASLQAAFHESQKQAKAKELDVASMEEKRAKLQAHLLTVKTNKEYAAIQGEIKNLKADLGKLEEAGLAGLSQADELKGRVTAAEGEIAAIARRLADMEAEHRTTFEKCDGEVAALRAQWGQMAAGVDAESLELYRRFAGGRDGQAVVSAEGGSCGGCFMGLNPQTMNLLGGGRLIVQCPSCKRILYVPPKEGSGGKAAS